MGGSDSSTRPKGFLATLGQSCQIPVGKKSVAVEQLRYSVNRLGGVKGGLSAPHRRKYIGPINGNTKGGVQAE
jgi:hypothetical protein